MITDNKKNENIEVLSSRNLILSSLNFLFKEVHYKKRYKYAFILNIFIKI